MSNHRSPCTAGEIGRIGDQIYRREIRPHTRSPGEWLKIAHDGWPQRDDASHMRYNRLFVLVSALATEPMPNQLPRLENCLNCGTAVSGNFCSHCGQENEDQTVALRLLVSDVCTEILAVDSKLLRTLAPLLVRPGFLTCEYNAGKRVRYLSPLKMYLFASVVFFLVASLNAPKLGPIHATVDPALAQKLAQASEQIKQAQAQDAATGVPKEVTNIPGLHAGLNLEDAVKPAEKPSAGALAPVTPAMPLGALSEPAVAVPTHHDRIASWVKPRAERLKSDPRALINRALDTAPKVMFVLLPLFALLMKLLYVRRKRLYVEHVIFALHFHAFLFAMLTIAVIVHRAWAAEAIAVYVPLYLLIAIRKVYDQSWIKTFMKFGILSFNYVGMVSIGIAVAFAIAFATF